MRRALLRPPHSAEVDGCFGLGGAGSCVPAPPSPPVPAPTPCQSQRGHSPGRRIRAAIGACRSPLHAFGRFTVLTVSWSVCSIQRLCSSCKQYSRPHVWERWTIRADWVKGTGFGCVRSSARLDPGGQDWSGFDRLRLARLAVGAGMTDPAYSSGDEQRHPCRDFHTARNGLGRPGSPAVTGVSAAWVGCMVSGLVSGCPQGPVLWLSPGAALWAQWAGAAA